MYFGGGDARDGRSAFRLPMGEIGRGDCGTGFSVGRERRAANELATRSEATRRRIRRG